MNEVSDAIISDNTVDPNLGNHIIDVLEGAGIPPSRWTPEILGPADQIHGGGLRQTQLHAALTEISADMTLLDIGCGIGGPARYFATEFGCRVTGIDITPEYINVARLLSEKVGLSGRLQFDCGDATSLPYSDGYFDMVWALNVTMNIEDRSTLYSEINRVLIPGGVVAISELGQGPNGEPYYPLPWARSQSYNFLMSPQRMRGLLEEAGFTIIEWVDENARRQADNQDPVPKEKGAKSPLTLEMVRGADYPKRRANSQKSAREGRLTNVMLVAEKN